MRLHGTPAREYVCRTSTIREVGDVLPTNPGSIRSIDFVWIERDVNLALYFAELSAITFVGVLLACKVFAYEIKLLRKAGAAICFALLNTIPIPIPFPFINILISAVGLYVCLMDDSYNRATVNKVFGLTFVFAVLATMGLYYVNI